MSELIEPTQPAETSEATTSEVKKEDLLLKMKEFLQSETLPARSDVESLRHNFQRLVSAEQKRLKAQFVEAGNAESDFVSATTEQENEFQTLYTQLKEKRAEALARETAEKEANLQRKLQIIAELEAMLDNETSIDDFGKQFAEFKKLQKEWNEIKLVPQEQENDLWKSFHRCQEHFYDLVRINNEMRDYDFKKNLELKTAIIEAVERLAGDADAVSAFHQLQNFHQEWREIGPVDKSIREELWARFKEASTVINKKHQQHFEDIKAREEENLTRKTEICEKIEAIDFEALTSVKLWEEKSKEVLELQALWKTISFVPKKVNTAIFERFRMACDKFFNTKSEYFKQVRLSFDENLARKVALCERAEALKDSTDWKKTTEELTALQAEWKTIGTVARKHSDAVWNRFRAACDHFFEQKKQSTSRQRGEELQNMEKKQQIIAEIKALSHDLSEDEAHEQLRALLRRWHEAGRVPFRYKDKLHKEMQEAADEQFARLRSGKSERKLQAFKSSIEEIGQGGKGKLLPERERLMRQVTRLRTEIQTYENNIGFLSVSSKGGSGLLKEMENKIQGLKTALDETLDKLAAVDKMLD